MKCSLIALVLILIVLPSCNADKMPSDVIKLDEMKMIIWDMVRAEQIVLNDTLFKTPSEKQNKTIALYQQVFYIYHIDKNRFYNSYKFYEEHPNLNRELIDSINQFSSRKRRELYNKVK